ncbi:MAG: DUF423 domain-containing protein [Acetobacteraceae bacterium]|nr:DUF423 domain-containing protein [Acetobacteraceae bacterium]
MFARFCILSAGLLGATAVAMAAMAAHGLADLAPSALAAVRSAIEMQGWHALALLGLAGWVGRLGGLAARIAALGFVLGTVLFCGGVYGQEILGWPVAMLAPVGGSTLIAAWLVLAAAAFAARAGRP